MKLKGFMLTLNRYDCRNIKNWIGFGCTAIEALKAEVYLAGIEFDRVMRLQAKEQSDADFVNYLNLKLERFKMGRENVS